MISIDDEIDGGDEVSEDGVVAAAGAANGKAAIATWRTYGAS